MWPKLITVHEILFARGYTNEILFVGLDWCSLWRSFCSEHLMSTFCSGGDWPGKFEVRFPNSSCRGGQRLGRFCVFT